MRREGEKPQVRLNTISGPAETTAAEVSRARQFWETRLAGQELLPTGQHPDCEFAIVVPVRSERIERIARQIESLDRQENVSPFRYEVLYVVNNGPAAGESPAALAANRELLRYLSGLKRDNVHALDCSSPGHEIGDCNVGRARNRGVAEACLRFHAAGKNGILIQTDADCHFDGQDYLFRLERLVSGQPDVIGVTGGLVFEFSPDSDAPEEIEAMRAKLPILELAQRWEYIEHWLLGILRGLGHELILQFSGAHMISRSLETAIIGGLADVAAGEDPAFSAALIAYAGENGLRVVDGRDHLEVVTAVRESFRTPSSFGRAFAYLDPARPPAVTDLGALLRMISGGHPEGSPGQVPLTWERYREVEKTVRQMPSGEHLLRRLDGMARRISAPAVRPPFLKRLLNLARRPSIA